MPTYDFICLDCRKRFSVFLTYKEYGVKPVACSHCGSASIRRRINRVRVAKSNESRMASLADPSALEGMEDDPKAMARMFRELGAASGEEMPPQFDDIVDRLESGQSPDEISNSIEDWDGGDMDDGHDHAGYAHSEDE